MGRLTIRDLDARLEERLRVRATQHGRSMEDEARDILVEVLAAHGQPPDDLGEAIHRRFAPFGGVELPDIPRDPIRTPLDFGEGRSEE